MNEIKLKRLHFSEFLLSRLDGDLERIAEFKLSKKDSNIVRSLATIHNDITQMLNEGGQSHE